MYDRTALIEAAKSIGDRNPSDTARRLKVARNTAWRLWKGKTKPDADTLAAVQLHYGLPSALLLKKKDAA